MVVIEYVGEAEGGNTAFVVVGPGSADASGIYAPTGRTLHGAPIFENDRKCLLSREPHKNQKTGQTSYGWILGQDRRPLYAVQSEALAPPTSGWKRFQGEAPVPELRSAGSLTEATLVAARAWKEQGNAHFAAQLYEEAAEAWSRALTRLEALPELRDEAMVVALLSNRSEVRLRQQRWELALADARAALERRPAHDKALLRAAVAARELGRLDEAQEFADRCLDEHPDSPEAAGFARDLEARRAGELLPAAAPRLQKQLRWESDEDGAGGRRSLDAFAGYGEARERQAAAMAEAPLSSLPYHHMSLPPEQIQLMDGFFQEMREEKVKKAKQAQVEQEKYERAKDEWREVAESGAAAGKLEPLDRILPASAAQQHRATASRQPAIAEGAGAAAARGRPARAEGGAGDGRAARDRVQVSKEDAEEIDSLFSGLAPKAASARPPPDRRTQLNALNREAASEAKAHVEDAMVELHRIRSVRRGEPARFEQAAGEVYAWWHLPPSISGKEVQVKSANDGRHLSVVVRGVTIFSGTLFHQIRGSDMLWSVDGGELHLTLTKGERSKLWEQLSEVSEVRRDAGGNVIADSVPEPMSSRDRLDRFRQMVDGDDGVRNNYDDLPPETKRMVDAMKRYEHARATGDNNALALAEMDLEEFGRLVV